ncbi:Sequestosome-1 [Mactra antiquata]
MSLTVKAFLQKDGKWDGEIRRFQIPADVSSSYDYLSKKLVDIFPSLRQGNFSLFWKDPDGDHVAFSTDEELMEALGFVSDSILKIFIVLKDGSQQSGPSSQGENEAVHHGVVCDGCEMGPICGPRYKCMICPDYDLCKNCEGQGIHVEHDMVKMTAPGSLPRFPFGGHGGPFGHGPHGPGPHGPGPHGPGPHGPFVPPPHFRRWMQRFMKRWHNRNAPGWECGANGDDKEEKKPADKNEKMEDESGESSGEEYLRNVGETVAEMLDPFGIDVDFEVQRHCKENKEGDGDKDDEKKGKGGRGRGRCRGGPHGRRARSGPQCGPYGMWGWMGGCPMGPMGGQGGQGGRCGKKAGQQCPKQTKTGETENKPTESCPQQGPSNASAGMNNTEPPKRAESPVKMDTDPSAKKTDDSWMVLNMNEAPPQPQEQPPEVPNSSQNGPSAPQAPIYPPVDPKIAEALQQMMAMGFNNEGGWLTSLLEAKGGDIIQVLDAIRPQQRSRTNENGTMA